MVKNRSRKAGFWFLREEESQILQTPVSDIHFLIACVAWEESQQMALKAAVVIPRQPLPQWALMVHLVLDLPEFWSLISRFSKEAAASSIHSFPPL